MASTYTSRQTSCAIKLHVFNFELNYTYCVFMCLCHSDAIRGDHFPLVAFSLYPLELQCKTICANEP